jgi:enamine deaminase RidA (YjgF/YER057c/UK114 family)
MIDHFERPDGLGPVTGYSHATAGTGRLVAVSGQLPVDADGMIVGTSDDVLRLNFYITDLADLAAVRTAREEFVSGSRPPASSLIQVAGLVLPAAKIEIDALAVTPA